MKISLILPAFNEEDTVAETILDFFTLHPKLYVYVINNNSTDNTYKKASECFKKHKINGGIINEYKKGKGNALRRAFNEIQSDIYVIADADTTYKAKDLEKMLNFFLKNDLDMLVGNRHDKKTYIKTKPPKFHNFGNILICGIINRIYNNKIGDVLSGYRIISKRFINMFPIASRGFEIETEMTTHAMDYNFKYDEIPISYSKRPPGSVSKLSTFQDGFIVLVTLFNIVKNHKPLQFFSILAIILLFGALFFGYFVLEEYINYSYIKHIPLAILSTGLIVLSLVLFITGIILDSIRCSNKILFSIMKSTNEHISSFKK